MAKRTIRVAFWRHKTPEGRFLISRFGDEVELPKAEIDRGEQAGVFDAPQPASPMVTVDLDQEPRVRQPDGAQESDAAPLNHDIATGLLPDGVVLRQDGEDLPDDAEPIVPTLVTEPISPDPAATLEVTPAATETDRPAKSAKHDVWVDFVVKATAGTPNEVTREQAENMTKDDLQAVKV